MHSFGFFFFNIKFTRNVCSISSSNNSVHKSSFTTGNIVTDIIDAQFSNICIWNEMYFLSPWKTLIP